MYYGRYGLGINVHYRRRCNSRRNRIRNTIYFVNVNWSIFREIAMRKFLSENWFKIILAIAALMAADGIQKIAHNLIYLEPYKPF